jgi:dipeptidyl aminopeptidase/acylaminoacyl peptidase
MEYYTGVECFQDKARLVSPYSYIENWNSSVLLVHTIDDTSVWFGQSVRSYNKGVSCGKDVRLILAPGPHSYDIPNAEHLFEEIIGFFLVELNHMSKI